MIIELTTRDLKDPNIKNPSLEDFRINYSLMRYAEIIRFGDIIYKNRYGPTTREISK